MLTKTLLVGAVVVLLPALAGCGASCSSVGRTSVVTAQVEGLPDGDIAGTLCLAGRCGSVQRVDGGVAWMNAPQVDEDETDVEVHLNAPVRVDTTVRARVDHHGGGFMSCEPPWSDARVTVTPTH